MALGEMAFGESTSRKLVFDKIALIESAISKSAFGEMAFDDTSIGELAFDETDQ